MTGKDLRRLRESTLPTAEEIARRYRAHMKYPHLSRRELALRLGVTGGTVLRWELGRHAIPEPVQRLAGMVCKNSESGT